MAGFTFKDRTVKVTIEGNDYEIQIGSAEMADRVAMAYTNLQAIGGEQLAGNERVNYKVSCMLRDLIGAILGKDAQDAIFESRAHSVIDEIELLQYLMEQVNAAEDAAFSITEAIEEVSGMMQAQAADAQETPITSIADKLASKLKE